MTPSRFKSSSLSLAGDSLGLKASSLLCPLVLRWGLSVGEGSVDFANGRRLGRPLLITRRGVLGREELVDFPNSESFSVDWSLWRPLVAGRRVLSREKLVDFPDSESFGVDSLISGGGSCKAGQDSKDDDGELHLEWIISDETKCEPVTKLILLKYSRKQKYDATQISIVLKHSPHNKYIDIQVPY